MDNIQNHDSFNFDLANPDIDYISPYDNDYPIVLLTHGLKTQFTEAQMAIKEIYRIVEKQTPILAQAKQALKKGCRYVVDISDRTLGDIESGKIKLTNENGNIYAQVRNGNRYGKKLPIKREVYRKGINPIQMANALQMQAMQDQLQTITNQISLISYNVKDILQGQQNDRIGLYYSGIALFLEAQKLDNDGMKQALIAQSLRALSEATFQLSLTMQSDIKYLENKEYMSVKKQSAKMIAERMNKINQSFAFIHQATILRAGVYCNQSELSAMAMVLEEYSHFIDNTVIKNIKLLSSYDKADDGTTNGLWHSRSNLKLSVSDITKQINAKTKTVYIGTAEEI